MDRLTIILGIGLGGAIGSVARYLLAPAVRSAAFPWGTLIVNVVGCFAIGALGAWFAAQGPGREALKLAVVVGVLGGFTTFSAFARETLDLLDAKRFVTAASYVLASNGLGVAAAWVGRMIVMRVGAMS